jgi:hypothetical protein
VLACALEQFPSVDIKPQSNQDDSRSRRADQETACRNPQRRYGALDAHTQKDED